MAHSTLPVPSPAEFPQVHTPSTTDDAWRERNAERLFELWKLGEEMAAQAFELPQPKPDPLTIALNGFPDVNTYRAHYAGYERD